MAMLDTYLRLPPFHYSQGEEWFNFAHENIRNTLNITYVKIKKKSQSRFSNGNQLEPP